MTAHPLELIAGMDDGLDLDEKDRVVRHIAGCDTCRSVARTMQRINALIAMPEPALPLPERATPREGVRVAGWAFAFAVVVALVATMVVLVGSSRQTQVASSDACGILAIAARSAGVGAATTRASAIELPSSRSNSWTACAYGDAADRAGPELLIRSRPTEGREVGSLLMAFDVYEPENRFWLPGEFAPATTPDLTEAWISWMPGAYSGLPLFRTEGLALPRMAVFADPYFFVVTAPTPDATERLAEAVLAELRRRPWPPLTDSSKTDACAVLGRAVLSAGLPTKDASGSPLTTHRAAVTRAMAEGWPNILTNVCGFESYAGFSSLPLIALREPHLALRDDPTTLQKANELLAPVSFPGHGTVFNLYGWVQIESGMWLVHGEDSAWSAVAVASEPYFFLVTEATDEAAIRLARAILTDLKRP